MAIGMNYVDLGGQLAQLGQTIGGGIQDQRIKSALSGLPENASWKDRANAVWGLDPEFAAKMAAYGDTYNIGMGRNIIAAQRAAQKGTSLSAAQTKALYTAEERMPALDNTIATYERALELNPKTFDGWFASERANIGARGPETLSGLLGIDKDGAMATEEWQRIMTPEAIQTMSASFKGSTTEKELLTMLNQIADPATPAPIRERNIRRSLALMKKERDVYSNRIRTLKPREGGVEDEAPASAAPPQEAIDALNADPSLADQFEEYYGVPADEFLLR